VIRIEIRKFRMPSVMTSNSMPPELFRHILKPPCGPAPSGEALPVQFVRNPPLGVARPPPGLHHPMARDSSRAVVARNSGYSSGARRQLRACESGRPSVECAPIAQALALEPAGLRNR
jgi:hypothetical protein